MELLRQVWRRPAIDESALLGLSQRCWVLVREVFLLCGHERMVFARTLIPRDTLRGSGRRLGRLGSRPLGQVLFSDSRAQRDFMQVARLRPRHSLYPAEVSGHQDIWARRTRFRYAGRPLLVNEVFLPALTRD